MISDPRWERLRNLLRRRLVTGTVDVHDGAFDTPRGGGHSRIGLDTAARCELVSVLMGLRLIKAQDRIAHQLLVREIGRPCRYRGHVGQGHCHRIQRGEMPLLADMEWAELEEKTDAAVEWLLAVTAGDYSGVYGR